MVRHFIGWRKWDDNLGDTSAILMISPCDIATTRFCVASLVDSKTTTLHQALQLVAEHVDTNSY